MRDLKRLAFTALIAAASQQEVLGRLVPGLKKSARILTESTYVRGIRGVRVQDPSHELHTSKDIAYAQAKNVAGRRTQGVNMTLQDGDNGIIGGETAQSGGMFAAVLFTI
jgi:hypothetical protein